ncbi:hypothetical protein GUJ93_ZPchr0010g9706 [Zizania palustris]|uniref:Uncharacterized protein n=1 Tax=Zizania palustris TaxID=103762 RepID=A0A8J5WGQ5_ZIZPA|nr:hypothetical protein GUJ93_ZPchr0010g9706 [Zizania palustris]
MELVPFKPAVGAPVESGGGSHEGSIPTMVAAQHEILHVYGFYDEFLRKYGSEDIFKILRRNGYPKLWPSPKFIWSF